MDLNKVFNIYIGVDYDSDDSRLTDISIRRRFSDDALEISNIFALPEENQKCHTSTITKADIVNLIADLRNSKYKGYDVLIYIAGHGFIDQSDGNAYFLTSDNQIGFQYIFDNINNKTNPDNVAVILDCCYSGGVSKEKGRENSYWITAAAEDATSNNQFHEALVSYLSSNNEDKTATGLIDYLQINLKLEQPQTLVRTSKPFFLRRNNHNSFDINFVNEVTLLKKGKSRTAYPIDISFAEIHSKKMYVEPTLVNDCNEFSLSNLKANLIDGKSNLILGNPGSGKSFLSYLTQKELTDSGIKNLSFTLNELIDIKQNNHPDGDKKTSSLYHFLYNSAFTSKETTVLIIDGLDEYNNWNEYENILDVLIDRFCLVAFSRTEEYQYEINNYIKPELFDIISNVKDWDFDNEFSEYITILKNNDLLKIDLISLRNRVSNFKDIINTPLYARMCVYVCDNLDENLLVYNKSTLYLSYLQKLASRFNIKRSQTILNLWKEIALTAFLKQKTNHNLIQEPEFIDVVKDISSGELRNLKSLLILKSNSIGICYNFAHYSFFEFIISLAISSNLQIANNLKDANLISNILEVEINATLRHYLIDLLNYDNINVNDDFIKFLFEIYNKSESSEIKKELIKKNSIIYLISKCEGESTKVLQSILGLEPSTFLRNSLYWACARVGNKKVFNEYILLLENNESGFSILNRGYHLFYYGDLIANQIPYSDDNEDNGWGKTREFMFRERISKKNVSSSLIKLLDIYTFIDLSVFHRTKLTKTEFQTLQTEFDELSLHLERPINIKFKDVFAKIILDE